jgi:hypothetical protein
MSLRSSGLRSLRPAKTVIELLLAVFAGIRD